MIELTDEMRMAVYRAARAWAEEHRGHQQPDDRMINASVDAVLAIVERDYVLTARPPAPTADGYKVEKCRSCNARVIWAATAGGKTMPVDADPVEDGNVELQPGRYGGGAVATVLAGPPLFAGLLRKSHFATCPQADAWRQR